MRRGGSLHQQSSMWSDERRRAQNAELPLVTEVVGAGATSCTSSVSDSKDNRSGEELFQRKWNRRRKMACMLLMLLLMYDMAAPSNISGLLMLLQHPDRVIWPSPNHSKDLLHVLDYPTIVADPSNPSQEFPYPLACPKFDATSSATATKTTLTESPYSIVLAYHVGMVKNWKVIVADQLRTLDQCGLGHAASHLILSYSNGNSSEILELIKPYNFKFQNRIRLLESKRVPWEGPIMDEIHKLCQAKEKDQQLTSPTVVFYFHNKGSSRYHDDWRNHVSESFGYSRSLYWRKYLEYFTIERPAICIDHIVHRNASTCAANLDRYFHNHHYSGNFWTASCRYISTLLPLEQSIRWYDDKYLAGEMWIGQHFREGTPYDFVNLFNEQQEFNPYHDLMVPELYSSSLPQNQSGR